MAYAVDFAWRHNHSLDERPRLFSMHFWATGDGVTLAETPRPAVDATNPATG
ncbi:DUF1259 domain-containing protein [Actinoallomurus iriomotensis]|uniref:Uncharacterized protein n=1 Tax=Actinoallomurus iriomotensis TaxID=478107 RepID=A0A9W6RHG9_9ACTN|nr:DUF1259 domain-containing protein [Actinoallomurus iriomotensis]GLY73990.1 hypothetical protein Airi01_022570 [Actinoallomurus iriomotensis]